MKSRTVTHRSADQDRYRWNNHLAPTLGKFTPDDVDVGMLKRLITAKLAEGLAPATVRLLVRLVSTLYSDLIDDGKATRNPARMLPKATRKLYRPTHDPKRTPFVERRDDIAKLFQALPDPSTLPTRFLPLLACRRGYPIHPSESPGITRPFGSRDGGRRVTGIAMTLPAWLSFTGPSGIRCPIP